MTGVFAPSERQEAHFTSSQGLSIAVLNLPVAHHRHVDVVGADHAVSRRRQRKMGFLQLLLETSGLIPTLKVSENQERNHGQPMCKEKRWICKDCTIDAQLKQQQLNNPFGQALSRYGFMWRLLIPKQTRRTQRVKTMLCSPVQYKTEGQRPGRLHVREAKQAIKSWNLQICRRPKQHRSFDPGKCSLKGRT